MKLKNAMGAIVATSLLAVSASGQAAISYSEDFEGMNTASTTDLSGDGWLIGNCLAGGGCWFGPGNGAPNSPAAGVNGYSALVGDQGGPEQGNVQLSVFSDYNGWSPFGGAGDQTLDTFVYRDVGTIGLDDVGETITFSFDVKEGNIGSSANTPSASAWAYINILEQTASYATLANIEVETTNVGTGWTVASVSLLIDAAWVGELMQIGFRNNTTEWDASGMYYDNLSVANASAVPVPAAAWLFGSALAGLAAYRKKEK